MLSRLKHIIGGGRGGGGWERIPLGAGDRTAQDHVGLRVESFLG